MKEKLKLTDDDIGKIFIRDANYRNGGKVRLLAIHGNHFCRIEDAEAEKPTPYDSMINRLTRIDVSREKES